MKRRWFVDEKSVKIPWVRNVKETKCFVIREKLFLFYSRCESNIFEISLHREFSRYDKGFHYWSGSFRILGWGIWWRTEPVWPAVLKGC